MDAYKKLIKNSGIFAIANMGSKLISILLVPLYTYVLTTEQYGTVDMFITSISLLLPIVTLSIYDATLRFSLKSKYSKKDIFSTSLIVVTLGNLVFLLLYPLLRKIELLNSYLLLFYLMLFIQTINSVFSQFTRGIGKVKQFALNGVINTFLIVISNILLLVHFRLGIKGYMISIIIANLICNLYLYFSVKLWKYFNIKSYRRNLLREMLIYSIPLMPNSLMWWIMNASDRYMITFFLGVAANGLYAVAYKIPTILNVVYSIFSQAWQLSAIEEVDSKNKSKFYSNVFNVFAVVMLIGTSIIIVFIKPVIEIFLSKSYAECWRYIPFLLLAVVFTSFSSFLGTNYIAMKKTKGVFKTSLIGAIINIILNIILIPIIGLNGAGIATMISFFIVWIIRIYDTKEFVNIQINIRTMSLTLIGILLQIILLYFNDNLYLNLIMQLVLLLLIIVINKNELINILKKARINEMKNIYN